MNHSLLRLAAICFGLLSSFAACAGCGSTVCPINTNWDEHSAGKPGLSIDLRYSSARLDQLRSGSNKVAAEDPTDPAIAGEEVENLYTENRLLTATLDYTVDDRTGFSVQLPYVMRTHKHTIADPAQPTVETFDAKAFGDVRMTGRYRIVSGDTGGAGIKAGLKLATGRKNVANDQGAIPGEVSLQPGNGSTDLILGAFWQQGAHGDALSYFAQALLQTPINHLADFKPGNQVNLDAGLRYAVGSSASALLQLNYQVNAQDGGSAAPADATGVPGTSTGGRFLYLTPGVSVALVAGTNLYALVQLPLYQYVNGEQLTASRPVTIGINRRF
ncbi:MAG: hypothetical protein HZB47_03915 [Nitrosomonadales bacterium]|nr:hypothetical protein [Nitrosomonadales bacterium]